MSRKINPQIVARPSAKVSEKLAEARRAQEQQESGDPAAQPAAVLAPKPGISDTAASRKVDAGLADRLAGVSETADSGDGEFGSGASSATGDLDSFAGAQPTGAAAAIGEAQRALADRFAAPELTDGPERVDAETAVADAKAGLPGSALREESNSMLFDLAGGDDGVTGIAEQGSGAVSDGEEAPTAEKPPAPSILTKEGRVQFMKDLFGGGGSGVPGATDGAGGVERTTGDVDLSDTSTGLLSVARLVTSNLEKGEEMTPDTVKVTPGGTVITESPGGLRTAVMTNGKIVTTLPDGTKTVRETDGSTATLHPNGEVTETAPKPPVQPGVSIPDPEGGDDFRFVSEGLKDRLAPKGVEGGGDIDFGDDIPFGVGVGAQVVDTQGTLLGDPGRGGLVDDGPATSGFTGLDPVRNSGAVDFEEETPFGGGLEDDPLAGSQSDQNLDGGLQVSDAEEDEEDTGDGADAAAADQP